MLEWIVEQAPGNPDQACDGIGRLWTHRIRMHTAATGT